jgi:hypothetical protein
LPSGTISGVDNAVPPPIRFYLPDQIPADLPASPDVYWTGFRGKMRSGVYAWIVQTYQRLRAAGFDCELTHTLPRDGIMVAHRKSLPCEYVPPPGLLFVCVRADATFHPSAHLHVVLNHLALGRWHPAIYLPHWPQAGLLPREPDRGDRWENAAFFGDPGCLSDEMRGPVWEAILRELELTWHFVGPEKWHDFREVDVVVAVRGFDRHRHGNKPPTKLFNAWHAGVPAVLGRESAYQHERRSALDYLEVRSFPEVVEALRQLKADPALRRAMTANGVERARESDPAVITARWRDFFETIAMPAYEKWRHASQGRRALFRWNGRLKNAAQRLRDQVGR